jgi:hypothetical protein
MFERFDNGTNESENGTNGNYERQGKGIGDLMIGDWKLASTLKSRISNLPFRLFQNLSCSVSVSVNFQHDVVILYNHHHASAVLQLAEQ